jgi:hypothetical protein
MTFADVCEDVWTGQVEDVAQIICADLNAGTSRDVCADVARVPADRSFTEEDEPFPSLVDWIERHGLTTYRRPMTRRETIFDRDYFGRGV